MRIDFHPDTDAAWIDLGSAEAAQERALNDDVAVGVDAEGSILFLDVHTNAALTYGLPNPAAVERLLEWARGELAAGNPA
ncbi:MAG: DUF2283 domain-containing protein [Thermoleophilia bacterium]|nr:DUF2283 domain-containing protein [Thermoleophilia bacterium]